MPQNDVLRFFKKLLLFLPLAILLSVPVLILFAFGELISVHRIIQLQEDRHKPVLIGLAYTNLAAYYQLQGVLKFDPDIITMGDSRVLPVRSAFFKKDIKFFNAGNNILKIDDFRHFLDRIPQGQEPKVIIMCLDQSYFNPGFDRDYPNADFSNPMGLNKLHNMIWMMLHDYRDKKFLLKDIFSVQRKNKFGLNAIVNHNGHRNDGSFYWGRITEHSPDDPETRKNFQEFMAYIAKGVKRTQFSSEPSSSTIDELQRFLALCSSRNIYVIGYLPPWTHASIELMKSMGDKDAYLFKLAPIFSKIFQEYHFGFFNFTDLADLGASDQEAYDCSHPSEKAYVRLFLEMIRHNEKLMPYVKEPEYLEKRLHDAKGPYAVFKENEF